MVVSFPVKFWKGSHCTEILMVMRMGARLATMVKPGVAVPSAILPPLQPSVNHVALGFHSGIRGAYAG
jgi:hypothetical protein